ncbi:survival of motor neuron-related-splicing factor 30-like [Ruditapes philippinarum]|uniref:survival of motor neuron-related-splicing factor 30-like n=1 Tax=Ruditapes philippinarum TaxID=129788 RepID=UPI00295BC2B4|nr:survival of motor neuron-related-splicing factor 30-like [Ruditapes philippinarum]
MADELEENVSMYRLQLQQVEDSLSLDPENEDLKKLKTDLQEVIQLTVDLIGQKQMPGTTDTTESETGDSEQSTSLKRAPVKHWQPGEKCLAIWSEDKNYYEATVDEILEDGSCTVTFDEYGNTDVTEVSLLKPLETESGKRKMAEGAGDSKKPLSKKDKLALEREYKRKKNQKKAQRQKQLEEERETEKNKWLDFNAKTFSKTSKGKVKKSIFATPDSVEGKVGVGTCGKSGKPMTQYAHADKWKK